MRKVKFITQAEMHRPKDIDSLVMPDHTGV